jgi:folate-dependent phosphoribosylglycinamide formyltransferase PurN
MSSLIPLLDLPAGTIPRAAIFMSGSGSNAERILESLQALAAPPLRIACLVTDAPETSRAREIGLAWGLPVIENDIKAFYLERGVTRISLATPEGRARREEWTNQLRAQLLPHGIHFGIFAGFVPLTNLTGDFPCLNVHPGDLTWLKDGRRHLVGLHTIPIERAILEGLDSLRTSVIIAEPYTGGGDDMDSGAIIGLSEPVAIDLQGHPLAELAACPGRRPEKRPRDGYGDVLESVARHNLNLLKENGDWVVFPPAAADFARGCFHKDAAGRLWYKDGDTGFQPIETVVYGRQSKELRIRL